MLLNITQTLLGEVLVPFSERPAGSELLLEASTGLFSLVGVYSLDRISPQLREVINLYDALTRWDVALHSALDGDLGPWLDHPEVRRHWSS